MDEAREEDPDRSRAEGKPKVDRRKRHEAKQVAAGFTRCIVRCHVDDVEKIKSYATALLAERKARG